MMMMTRCKGVLVLAVLATAGMQSIRAFVTPSSFRTISHHYGLKAPSSVLLSDRYRGSGKRTGHFLAIVDPSSSSDGLSLTTTILASFGLENDAIISSDNLISQAFRLATFGPQFLWLLMTLFPNTNITKKVMGGYGGIIVFSFIHLFIVIASASQEEGTAPILEFQKVFDPSPNIDQQSAMVNMMTYPNFVTEEWSHVLTWDLFVGRWIWMDGLKRGIFTPHSVLLCNLIGPPGLLLHFFTCLVTGKSIVGNEALSLKLNDEEE